MNRLISSLKRELTPDNPSITTSTLLSPVSVILRSSKARFPLMMRLHSKKLSRTDKASWTATLTPKRKNMTRSERNLREFVTPSSRLEWIPRARMKRRSSAIRDSDFV